MTNNPPVEPIPDRRSDDNNVLNEIKRLIFDSSDEFGKLIADGVQNNLDLASHYPFSAERLRLYRNGSRLFPQYNSISQFSDDADVWTLQPDAGDTMYIRSAESVTYVVNYVLQLSQSFELNQSLTDGDVVRWGAYNGNDGWFIEQRGADHTDDEFDVIQSRDSTETTLATNISLPRPLTDWTRLELRYNWYNVGNQRWRQTYTDNGSQLNNHVTQTSNDGERGPTTGNLKVWCEVQADASTSGLELKVGSAGAVALGKPVSLTRSKPQLVQETVSGTDNAWEPVYALRLDPNKPDVTTQFNRVEILNYGANDDLELLGVVVAPPKTDASGWGDPEYHHSPHSALEATTNISEVPNASGTQTDLGTSEKPGGYTVATATDIGGGNSTGTSSTVTNKRQDKKTVSESDELVFLARTGTTGSDVSFVWSADQNW